MKILLVSEKLPWPLDTGGNVRTFHLLRGLAADHQVTLASGVEPGWTDGAPEPLRSLCQDVCVTPIGPPTPLRDALTLAGTALGRMPFLIARRESASLRALAGRLLRDAGPFDAVHFNHLDACLYMPEVPAGVRRVLDAHNVVANQALTTLRAERRLSRRLVLRRDLPRLAAWEREAASAMDACLACSDVDRDALLALGVRSPTWVLPNGVDVEHFRPRQPPASHGARLVFVGTLDYDPCEQGVWHFCRNILPLIRRAAPDCRFDVVGRNPSARLRRLAQHDPAVQLHGRVEDVRPYLHDAAVAVVPLLAGSGTRLKILEAMAAGVPVVSTAIGAEGIALAGRDAALVVDDSAGFADAVLALLRDPARRAQVAANGRRLVEEAYSWRSVQASLREVYARLASGAAARDGGDG